MSLPPVHAEAGAGPQEVRWVVPSGVLSFVGRPIRLPAPLQELVDDGIVVGVDVEASSVRMRLADGETWAARGAEVRRRLQLALGRPAEWMAERADPDAVLVSAAREVLAGATGDFVRSHGGEMSVVGARDGVLTLRVGGACSSCPALGLTLALRVEREVRRRAPGLVAIERVTAA